MKKIISILTIFIIIISCEENELNNESQAKYTYGVNDWENLGSQTLVLVATSNSSNIDQNINFTISVINKNGKRFSKDTTVHFTKTVRNIDFEILVETEGEIEKVEIIAKD